MFVITAIDKSAPDNDVRRVVSSNPASISHAPVNTLYAREAPMNVQSNPIGDDSPYGSSKRCNDGGGNCDWITFTAPYCISTAASAKRTYTCSPRNSRA